MRTFALLALLLPALAAGSNLRLGADCPKSDTAALTADCKCGTTDPCIATKYCSVAGVCHANTAEIAQASQAAAQAAAAAAATATTTTTTAPVTTLTTAPVTTLTTTTTTVPACLFGGWSMIVTDCTCGSAICKKNNYCYHNGECKDKAEPKTWSADGSLPGLLIKKGAASHNITSSPTAMANVQGRSVAALGVQDKNLTTEGVNFYKHVVKTGDTLHSIATHYFCGYGALWDHLFSATVHGNLVGPDKVGPSGDQSITWSTINDADNLKLGDFIAVPIMKNTRCPDPTTKKAGKCPNVNAANRTDACK